MPTRLDGERPTPNQRQGKLYKSRPEDGSVMFLAQRNLFVCFLNVNFFSSRENRPNKLNENAQVHYSWMWKGKIYRDLCLQSLTDCVVFKILIIESNCLNYFIFLKIVLQEFRLKAHLARHLATAHGLVVRSGSPRPVMKTRAAFCLITTPLTRISRRLCKDILNPRRAARSPFIPVNIAAIKQECKSSNEIIMPRIFTVL